MNYLIYFARCLAAGYALGLMYPDKWQRLGAFLFLFAATPYAEWVSRKISRPE